jgi:hypothetical protein
MPETDETVLNVLRSRALARGFFVGRHVQYDVLRNTGDLFLMERSYGRGPMPSLLKYKTAAEILESLNEQTV